MPTMLPEEILVLIFENFALPDIGVLGDVQEDVRHFHETLGDVWTGAQPSEISTYRKPKTEDEIYCYQLEIGECLEALYSLCLTCKSFHRLAWPILYRGFTTHMLDTWLNQDRQLPSATLLRTICLKPEYGFALRSLSIGDWDPIEAMDAMDLFNLLQGDATIVALFQWRARAFWFGDELENETLSIPEELHDEDPIQRSLHRSLNMGLLDGHMALLLLMCPNIRHLDISPPLDFATSTFANLLRIVLSKDFKSKPLPDPIPDFEEEESDYIVAQMFGAPWPNQKLQKPLVLQQLRSLTIRSPGITSLDFRFLKQLMSLPSLETLRVNDLEGGFPKALVMLDVKSKCPQLKTLQFLECQLNANELAAIVECCPNLEKLYVVWTKFRTSDGHRAHLSPEYCIHYGTITKALVEHCPNLTVLKLGGPEGRCNVGAEPKQPFIIGDSLHPLERLAVLQVDAHSIYGSEYGLYGGFLAETVPENLVVLEVSSWEEHDPSINQIHAFNFQEHQDLDLEVFLKSESCHRLGRVELPGRVRAYDLDGVKKRGWEIKKYDNPLSIGSCYDVLINKARLEAHGFQRFAR